MILITVLCFSMSLVDIVIRYEKLHIVALLTSLTMVIIISRRKEIASTLEIIRMSLFIIIIGLSVSTGAYMITQGYDLINSMTNVLHRIALIPGRATAWYFEIYPRLDDYSWFSTSRTVRYLLDIEYLAPQWGSLAQDVAYIASGGQFIYDANVALPGEAW